MQSRQCNKEVFYWTLRVLFFTFFHYFKGVFHEAESLCSGLLFVH